MIRPFEPKDLNSIARLDPEMAREIRFHEDVFPDSVLVSVFGGRIFGAGYVMQAQGRFRTLVFLTRTKTARGVEAAGELVSALIGWHRKHGGSGRKKDRPILRLWCRAGDLAYAEFLESFGFAEKDRMLLMERPLSGPDAAPQSAERPADRRVRAIGLSDEDALKTYLESAKEAYGMPDRPGEIRYRLTKGRGKIWSYVENGAPVSFVTVWRIWKKVYATENVFTKKDERHRGHAAALLQEVAEKYRKQGAEVLRLTVYADDTDAVRLYQKLGYRKVDETREYWI